MSRSNPTVTIAIATFNRAASLRTTLDSLTRLKVPSIDWNLLVVDNGSTDDTQSVCASFSSRLPIRALVERTPGVSNARNLALQEASGDYILFTDDDVEVDAHWLEEFVSATHRWPEAAVFGGIIEPQFPETPSADLLAAFPALGNGFCGVDHRRDDGPLPAEFRINGANMAFKRSATATIRFDPRLGPTPTSLCPGEEADLIDRIRAAGGQVVWCPAMRINHPVAPYRMTIDYLIARYIGSGEDEVKRHGIETSPVILGIPRWLYRKWLRAYARYVMARVSAPRVEALTRLRELCVVRGMVRACRAGEARWL
jgi:glycosyltransferase involved in cell wall biosynthesis